jgi:hypothetical protein
MAAWIPRIQKFTTIIAATAIAFHVVQTTIRFTTSDDRPLMFVTWYPFDATKSPAYELISITQVRGLLSEGLQFICLQHVTARQIQLQNYIAYTLRTCVYDSAVVGLRYSKSFRCG